MRSLRTFRSTWSSALAVLVLLLGTAAPALARMTCVNSGHTVMSVGQARECCPADHGHRTTTVKPTCCELTQAQPQRNAFLTTHGPELPPLTAVLDRPVAVPSIIVADPGAGLAPFSRPPPPDGIRRLAAIGTFLI